MKNLELKDLERFVLTNEEMINVRGGNGIMLPYNGEAPSDPPVIVKI